MNNAKMNDVVRVGELELLGEIIRLESGIAFIEVYEETSGLQLGEPVVSTEKPISVELGPGLIGLIFDGIQRPLDIISEKFGPFIPRGVQVPSLDREKKWHFVPKIEKGKKVGQGDIIGEIQETDLILHKIMVPYRVSGNISEILDEGDYTINENFAIIQKDDNKFKVLGYQFWPIREPRPFINKIPPQNPLITGQRIIDSFYPVSKGGTACIPGGFGTGKTVTLQTIAKSADASIIIYIGCGERGNEMADLLEQFPKLEDPNTGKPLLDRTILIANTSNMPVSARESSIYTGITIAEYFRDQGYDVALIADSTSRWAEALREISGNLEEIPAEEGYPPYLASRLADFYERSGRVKVFGNRIGSVTLLGAISPPANDFSEPVTQYSIKLVRTLWQLDWDLAHARHYPAIDWINSFSRAYENIVDWYKTNLDSKHAEYRQEGISLLTEYSNLQNIIKIIGEEGLPEDQRLIVFVADLLKDGFLRQSALDPIDKYCSMKKQQEMLKVIVHFYRKSNEFIEKYNVSLNDIKEFDVVNEIKKMKNIPNEDYQKIAEINKKIENEFEKNVGA